MQNFMDEFFDAMLQSDNSKYDKISIYYNNYLGVVCNALKVKYEATVKLLSEEFFDQVARSFALHHIPRQSHLNDYGLKFIKYMCSLEHTQSFGYLKELMYLEFLLERANNAHKIAKYPKADQITTDSILRLDRDANVVLLNYNANDIRLLCLGEVSDGQIIQKQGYYLVFRSDLRCIVEKIDNNVYKMCRLFHKNKKLTLESIFSSLDMRDDEMSNALAYLLENNLLVCNI